MRLQTSGFGCQRLTSGVLNAGASIQATLTLTAASNTGNLTTFSCDVTLTGPIEIKT